LRLSLLDDTSSMPISSPITLHAVEVSHGQFAVDVDFGIDLSNAPALRLKTEVAQGDAQFVALGEPSRFDAKAALVGVCWDTEGNAGTNPATNFIGTTDNQPLVLRTRNVQSLRIEPSDITSGAVPINAGLFIEVRGRITIDGQVLMTEKRLHTVKFDSQVAYFRKSAEGLTHIYGAHYDHSESHAGHPVFHGQIRSYVDRRAQIEQAFQISHPCYEAVDYVHGVLTTVSVPTAPESGVSGSSNR